MAVRRFNRFYTRLVGALDEGHLHSPYSLAEVRVLYEIVSRVRPTASEIGRELRLDAGYMSRMLRGLEERGVIRRIVSEADARQSELRLTPSGISLVAELQQRAGADVAAFIAPLPDHDRQAILGAMALIERTLAPPSARATPAYTLRMHRPGDMGWVISRHGALYAEEYRWDATFEALVARIAADFIEQFDPARERCWIAERDGVNVGSVFVVKHPEREGVAKLRMLIVDPAARGLGIGKRLVDECTAFARSAGYHTLTLWTNSILHSARHLYENAGYRLVSEEPHHSFGVDLVGQYWELSL